MTENKISIDSWQGFIKIHRKLLDWEWYDDINTKVLFIHCLLRANFKDIKWHGVDIKRGSFLTSYKTLSKETKISVQAIRTAIAKLKSTREITIKTTNLYQIISVVNYNDHQKTDKPINKPINNQATIKQQASNNQTTTDKELKNDKKEYIYNSDFENIYKLFNPTCRIIPTDEKLRTKTQKAIEFSGGYNELRDVMANYLKYLEVATWRKKKGFAEFLNNQELLSTNWMDEKEKELKKTEQNSGASNEAVYICANSLRRKK